MKGFALFFFLPFFFLFVLCFVRGGVFLLAFLILRLGSSCWFFFFSFFFLGLFWMETLLLLPFVSREKISVVVVMANVIYIYIHVAAY